MSEFQCYQFKSFDRPLTEDECKEVGTWSSRAQVTANSATFIYHYGDFRKSPEWAVELYFDAMIYFANWGTRRLLFRLPTSMIDAKALKKFCIENDWSSDFINFQKKGAVYLLYLHLSNEEGGVWMEEDDFDIDVLGKIRDDLMEGDYRALYLLWAKFATAETDDDEEDQDKKAKLQLPPPVPPNLKKLNATLKAFIEFFEIDESIVSAAQAASVERAKEAVDYKKLLQLLPDEERIEWLERVINGEPKLSVLLKKTAGEVGEIVRRRAAMT
ncbi:hypothetical protein [Haliscomenobacter hydrossis]|uniref:Uncharacterized protein n=1 Tax=Haliscomenobacter hydrossis (strain ATCC 27775 / DSM 1100 / LMG 10767 / O) TaxID=760192 RepID=F4L892_HALH1|nr:hypothetical protein [Haliscomenobacter hydrossis]AEE54600.1 hypothetical protein Halhy_6787 [Haliscomenobacter hydrossis DSM 1100]